MRLILFLALIFSIRPASATLTVSEVLGASRTVADTTNNVLSIYGGAAGGGDLNGCATRNNVDTCDNCGADWAPCNKNRVYPDLSVRITVVTTGSDVAGKNVILKSKTTGTVVSLSTTATIGGAGSSATIAATWAAICAAAVSSSTGSGTNGDCSTSFQQDFVVGVDKTADGNLPTDESYSLKMYYANVAADKTTIFHPDCSPDTATADNGFCNFTVAAGDQKVYVDNVKAGNYPTAQSGIINFDRLRFYYVEGPDVDDSTCTAQAGPTSTFAQVNYKSNFFDISTSAQDGKGVVSDRKITGLDNDKTYYFRMANVDASGNVYLVSPAGDLQSGVTGDNFLSGCLHAAKPGEVVGLIQEQSCFIATAAYGSGMAPEVQKFRAFRNQYLLPTWFGRKLVKTYYKFSPPVAQFIAHHENLRTAARGMLWPILGVVELFLWNSWIALLFILTVVALVITMIKRSTQKVGR